METVLAISAIVLVIGAIALGTWWSIARSHRNFEALKAQWPVHARQLELAWLPSPAADRLGRAWGVVHGREVLVTPDEPDKLVVQLRCPLPFRLTHGPTSGGPSPGPEFHLGRPALDAYFEGRVALAVGFDTLLQCPGVLAALERFVGGHGASLIFLRVGETRISCSPLRGSLAARNWEGDGALDYIAPGQVDALLPDLIRLADVLEGEGLPDPSLETPDVFDTHDIREPFRVRALTELAAMVWQAGPPSATQRADLARYAAWLGLGRRPDLVDALCAEPISAPERDYRHINVRKRARLLYAVAHFVYLSGPVRRRAVAALEQLTTAMQIPEELTRDWLGALRATALRVKARTKRPA